MKTYIGKRGYVIIKKYFDEEFLTNIRNRLMVKPFVNSDYGEVPEPFPVFLENKNKLYIPKFWGIENVGKPDEVNLPLGAPISLSFNGSLRDNQKEPIDAVINSFNSKGGGLLSLPCGQGKTACACYLIAKMKVKAFVMVHKEFLLNQWIERIEFFLPGARIGRIQGSKIDIEDKDIVIGMIQSISMKNYEMNTFDSFGMTILDEAHRVPSREFSKALAKINSRYMLGLSATPDRKDGLTKVLKWFIGDVVFSRKGKSVMNSQVERYILEVKDKKYNEEEVLFNGKINSAKMINKIATYQPRINFIVSQIHKKAEENRQILLLSDRKELLSQIEEKVSVTVGYYIGGMKPDDLKLSEEKQLILATFQMAAEGLDIKTIDTIILATPKTDIEQAVGRIRPRVGEDFDRHPLVIDMVDSFSIFKRQGDKRMEFYKKKKYQVDTFSFNKEGNITKKDSWNPEEKPEKAEKKGYVSKKLTGFCFSVE